MSIKSFHSSLQSSDSTSALNRAFLKLNGVSNPAELLNEADIQFRGWDPWNPDSDGGDD